MTGEAPTSGTRAALDGIAPSLRSALVDQVPSRAPSPALPATSNPVGQDSASPMVLELSDGTEFQGISFGAEGKSISGECVFQTGMVGYVESLTDPSYEGQILVLTYPLIGNYGVPKRPTGETFPKLAAPFESSRIHVAGLVVAYYSHDFSHYLAESGLSDWLKENGVPAVYGIDTRALTKRIRTKGSMLARLLASNGRAALPSEDGSNNWRARYHDVAWHDPNGEHLVKRVSCTEPKLYTPQDTAPAGLRTENAPTLTHASGRPIRILALDMGMKLNQIRCFTSRGVELKVVPFDYDFLAESEPYDGLFVSNGPGDPTQCMATVERLRMLLNRVEDPIPVFGICLGHQLLALAAGAQTSKMKYGNRGQNIPCTDQLSGRCFITSQNHGYAVDAQTLPAGWAELFVNANDGSNEGIYCENYPYFSVQFHPESTAGPRDTEYLFDVFIRGVVDVASVRAAGKVEPHAVAFPGGKLADHEAAHPRLHMRKVLVLGSGGLSIGQAGEFDYSGSQAIKALKEEGIYTILINPNIATIQTSSGLADKVYFLPVTPEFVLKVLRHERPDGIYCTFGGQTALNVGIKIKDELGTLGVRNLGTPIDTIIKTEDRDLFSKAMEEIGERCAPSASANNWDEALTASKTIGFPVIVRAAYALGGLGSGFAKNEEELRRLCHAAFANSPQVLVEKSMKGWKEVEYEVVRDCRDNCITVCNMENFDPLGVHTGDSIVIAPSQTLSDEDYNMLRTTAVNVIRHLGVVGECNIQYALNPHSREYCIIEVNARLSRSSALASKATGYPLAFVAAKLGLNIPLNELRNNVTRETSACFEPSLDYVVTKIPRWDLRKFERVSSKLGSSMKSVGEVMAIGRTFEESMQKAIRSIDPTYDGFGRNEFVTSDEDIRQELEFPTDKRIFAIGNALYRNYTVDQIHALSNIDRWFLRKLEGITTAAKTLEASSAAPLEPVLLRQVKQLGFSDRQISRHVASAELAVRQRRKELGITPFVKQIDTVAAEFPAQTNYLYMTYNAVENDVVFTDHGVMVLGSGVYRIGSSVEFDWCAVRAIRTLREKGYKTVMVNYNPETVSTDYDEADRLYFENISLETVMDIYEMEQSSGVIISMGGQTPNNIALPLHRQGVKVLGTSPEMIDMAENRYKFSRMLDKIDVDQPMWKELTSLEDAYATCARFGYPVLVRPSYVLSGAAMNVVYSPEDLSSYLSQAAAINREHPVVITKYLEGAKEIEMDAVAKDGKLVMHYVSEHVENAGVHSGDATLILPPQDLEPETVRRIELATSKIGSSLNVTGPFNIQFIAKNNEIKVIECNVRAARSFPFVSKVTGVDAIELATCAMMDLPVEPYPAVELPHQYVGVKVPQFSFSRLAGADPILGVEMASTGEVACFGRNKYEAYLRAMLASGIKLPTNNVLLSVGSFSEKQELLPSVRTLHELGFTLYGSSGTADFYTENNIPVIQLEALPEDDDFNNDENSSKASYSLLTHLTQGVSSLFISLPSKNKYRRPSSFMSMGYRARRLAIDRSIPLITNVKNAKLFVEALAVHRKLGSRFDIFPIDAKTSHLTYTFPGLVGLQAFVPSLSAEVRVQDIAAYTRSAALGGFTNLVLAANGAHGAVCNEPTLAAAEAALEGQCATDVSLTLLADPAYVESYAELAPRVRALFVSFRGAAQAQNRQPATLASYFEAWPEEKLIVTDAGAADLASMLLHASLYQRAVHVTNVARSEELQLIAMSKQKGLRVTCDVDVYSLFFDSDMYPTATCLPSKAEQDALWAHLDKIDAFSLGDAPYRLAGELGHEAPASAGLEEAMRLLLNAANEQRLSLDTVLDKMSTKPREIFGLPEQADTSVSVEVDRAAPFAPSAAHWSPLESAALCGGVHRVLFRGTTVVLDGEFLQTDALLGANISGLGASKAGDARADAAPPSPTLPLRSPGSKRAFTRTDSLRPLTTVGGAAVASTGLKDAELRELPPSLLSEPEPSTALQLFHPTFSRRHILSVKQFNREDLHALFTVAQEMRFLTERYGVLDLLRGRVMSTLFFEESTRTSSSFDAAMNRLGGRVVAINTSRSSVAKGETLADTVRTLGCYSDAIVLRHPAVGSSQEAAKFSPVPIINAGDGIGEHPTQALLDVFTIREELGTVNGLTITLVGDLKNGRTTHSLVRLLALYGVTLNFVAPPSLEMPREVVRELGKQGIPMYETSNLDDVIGSTDVLYVTRIQRERFASIEDYEKVKGCYVVNNDVLARAKADTVVLHPLPRVDEIDPEVDFDTKRAAYFRQMRYGMFIRMALLAMVLQTGDRA
ncbi:Carbamoyl-phosphate synthase [Malassezia obtusa]|uniref:Ammonium-dependent carbamoyl phosphate synthetase n=1 Tax=Malassezia obtusa TaxID=76774 RepID=A0AAF0DXM2_9BASI|nr:Carbamoyl-phosphate synthase [Malassezia obtusa]